MKSPRYPAVAPAAIQSEVAWRAALRPFTVPASWIAPPNSSSFSVSVVLPASGWEMMAKVRRRATSLDTTLIAGPCPAPCAAPRHPRGHRPPGSNPGAHRSAQSHATDTAGSPPDWRDEPPEHIHHAQPLRKFQQVFQQLAADAAAPVQRAHTQVQHMRLASAGAHDGVADADVIQLDHAAVIARPQAIAEYRVAPGEGVGLPLQLRHRRNIIEPMSRIRISGSAVTPSCHRQCGARTSGLPRPCASRWVSAADRPDDRSPPAECAPCRRHAHGRAACRWEYRLASRFWAAMRPTASMMPGRSSAIWRSRYGRHCTTSSGFGSRLPGGRHLSTLAMNT